MRSLIDVNPKQAYDLMLEAYRAEGGVEKATAQRLGCSYKNLCRWRRAVDAAGFPLSVELEKIRDDSRKRRRLRAGVKQRTRRKFDVEQPDA